MTKTPDPVPTAVDVVKEAFRDWVGASGVEADTFAHALVSKLWPVFEEAYSLGYSSGYESCDGDTEADDRVHSPTSLACGAGD